MSSLAAPPFLGVDPVSADLTARAGLLAWRVADVVERHCSPESGASHAVSFLRDWAETTGEQAWPLLETPLGRLASAFTLSEEETDLLVLAGLPEEHEGLATTFRSLHPQAEPRPTVGLAALLLGGGLAERHLLRGMLCSGSAVGRGLLRVEGSGPFFERSLAPADGLWSALHGFDAWPASLSRIPTLGPPAGMEAWLDSPDVRTCVAAILRGLRALIVVPHEDRTIGRSRCEAIAAAAGVPLVGAVVALNDPSTVALALMHATLRGGVPLLEPDDVFSHQALPVPLGSHPGPVLVTATPGAVLPAADRAVLTVAPAPVPTASVRAAWAAALPGLNGSARALAARHPLDPAVTAQLAHDLAVIGGGTDPGQVSGAIRSRIGVTLPSGTRLVSPRVGWAEIVLPDDALSQLKAAAERLDQQGTVLEDWGFADHSQASQGVRMLFTGPPGTGKSLASAVLATAVGTDLMVVDVSRLVSKWLGETEKNLSAVFDAAERTRSVLLLDEADALFGTRTEISDAHDRYANLETAYLLQRVEQFDGMVVLTSNLRQNIDPAFTRRLDFVVEFPLPDLAARHALWRRCLPAGTLGAALDSRLDLDALARLYAVPGGWIRNAAVAAAFAAAAAGEPITQRRLVDAVRREYQKASTPFPGEPPRRRNEDI